MWLLEGEKSLICLAVSTKYRRVTDKHTDGQTDILRQHSPRYVQHRVVKTIIVIKPLRIIIQQYGDWYTGR